MVALKVAGSTPDSAPRNAQHAGLTLCLFCLQVLIDIGSNKGVCRCCACRIWMSTMCSMWFPTATVASHICSLSAQAATAASTDFDLRCVLSAGYMASEMFSVFAPQLNFTADRVFQHTFGYGAVLPCGACSDCKQ